MDTADVHDRIYCFKMCTVLKDHMPSHWQFQISCYIAAAFADAVAAKRTCIHLWSDYNGTEAGKINNGSLSEQQGFAQYIQDNVHIAHDTKYIDVSEAMGDHCDSNKCFIEPRVVAVPRINVQHYHQFGDRMQSWIQLFQRWNHCKCLNRDILVIGLEFLSEMAHKDGMPYPKQL